MSVKRLATFCLLPIVLALGCRAPGASSSALSDAEVDLVRVARHPESVQRVFVELIDSDWVVSRRRKGRTRSEWIRTKEGFIGAQEVASDAGVVNREKQVPALPFENLVRIVATHRALKPVPDDCHSFVGNFAMAPRGLKMTLSGIDGTSLTFTQTISGCWIAGDQLLVPTDDAGDGKSPRAVAMQELLQELELD